MTPEAPSRTAWGAARHRAVHQLVDGGSIFADPLAVVILGEDPDVLVAEANDNVETAGLRRFIAARSRLAETRLAEGVSGRGVGQLVVLGAGFDTFAWRNPFGGRLRIFEVDHPATQLWKRERVAEAGLGVPPDLVFASVDFEREGLADGLRAAGFDPAIRSFFMWLGVVPYLSLEAIDDTLAMIGALPGGGEVVFDYAEPPELLGAEARARHQALADRVAAAGEPLLSHFEPTALRFRLEARGFTAIDDYSPPSPTGVRHGGHIVHAAT